MAEIKKEETFKVCFYSILSSGHLNVCATLGKILLDNHPDFEVYFVVDAEWKQKLSAIDQRFKYGVFEYENDNMQSRMTEIVVKLESCLKMSYFDKLVNTLKIFLLDDVLFEVDSKSEELIKKIKPNLLLCDQGFHLPAMLNSNVPYAFVVSCNPLLFSFDDFPYLGSDCRVDEKEKSKEFRDKFEPYNLEMRKTLLEFCEKRGAKFNSQEIEKIRSDHFSVYCYPSVVDYYSEDIKISNKLMQIDSPLYPQRVPKPFELPEAFAKLPGKIVYVSLGSLFSIYTHLLQRLIDVLEKLPYKYIVSKGMKGHDLKFPSNKFIGENYVDQLAVLQVVDGMIAHGGNNTFCETMYFGVPSIIMPIIADQINNALRLEETGFGFHLDILKFTEEQLADRLDKILNDQEIKMKWKSASEKIQKENRIVSVVGRIAEYVRKL